MREETVGSVDGLHIFVRSWVPAATKGVVVICHGFNSHSGYYVWTGEHLAVRGLATYALDLRGRGRSDGERFYIENVSDYVHDTLEHAPHDTSVEIACVFWRKFVFFVTDGDTRRWATSLFNKLTDLADNDPLLDSYEDLGIDMEQLSDKMRALLDCAFEADPAARLGIYHEACSVDKLVSNVANIIGELVLLRRDSAHCLVESERSAMLIYQTL